MGPNHVVKAFQCDVCDARRAPKAVKDSAVPRDLAPLRYIGIDVKWLTSWKKDHPVKALNIVCRASGLQRMYPFRWVFMLTTWSLVEVVHGLNSH